MKPSASTPIKAEPPRAGSLSFPLSLSPAAMLCNFRVLQVINLYFFIFFKHWLLIGWICRKQTVSVYLGFPEPGTHSDLILRSAGENQ